MKRVMRGVRSPATVISLIALVVALGGTGYAAITLPAHSVGPEQLKNRAVTGKKIHSDAVSSPKVKDFSLRANDFAPGQLPAGPRGEQGLQGDRGPMGPTAATADGNYESAPASPTLSVVLKHSEINMPTAGKVYAQGSVRTAGASCTFAGPGIFTGNCTLIISLYVDGQPIPKTGVAFGNSAACNGCGSFNSNIQDNLADHFSLFGVSGTVPAGTHDVQLVGDLVAQPNNGNTNGSVGPNAPNAVGIVGGIAIGGWSAGGRRWTDGHANIGNGSRGLGTRPRVHGHELRPRGPCRQSRSRSS